MTSIESVKGMLKWQMLKQCKLVQFDKALCQWFMCVLKENFDWGNDHLKR